jgi:small subunit ribosomal protein S8
MDKIAEMLTIIRNAQMAGLADVTLQPSKFKLALAKILQKEGYLESISEKKDGSGVVLILKYNQNSRSQKTPAIKGIRKISKSGQRIYIKNKDIKSVKNRYGLSIFSTSRGMMTGEEAKKLGLGGECICEVW